MTVFRSIPHLGPKIVDRGPRRPKTILLGPRSTVHDPRSTIFSPMRTDAHLAAHLEHRTGRALRERAGANVLAEGDEQAVDLDPVTARKNGFKGRGRFLRGASLDVA